MTDLFIFNYHLGGTLENRLLLCWFLSELRL